MPEFRDDAVGERPAAERASCRDRVPAGLVVRGEKPFRGRDADYRVIPSETPPDQLMFSHISRPQRLPGGLEFRVPARPLARARRRGRDRIGGGDPLFLCGRDGSGANGTLCARSRVSAEVRRGTRGSALSRLTALHARRERAGALPRGRGHSDGGDQPHSGADRKNQAAACPLGSVRAGPPVRPAEQRGVPEAGNTRGIAPARTRARARDHRGFSRRLPTGTSRPHLAAAVRQARSRGASAARLAVALEGESERVEVAYRGAAKERERTIVGLSGLSVGVAGRYMAGWLRGQTPQSLSAEISAPLALRFAVDDPKAAYIEIALSGSAKPSSRQLADWLWNGTAAGAAIFALRSMYLTSDDAHLKAIAGLFLVPGVRVPPSG